MDMDEPEAMSGSGAGVSSEPFRRFELFTGVGRRRSLSTEEKLALVARMAGCDNISELARRHDLRPSQLFTWRRELRYVEENAQRSAMLFAEPMFVPAVIEPAVNAVPEHAKPDRARRRRGSSTAVELEIDGVEVRIARGADVDVIAAVIGALRTPL